MNRERYLEILNKYLTGDDDETIKDLEELSSIDFDNSLSQEDIDKAVKAKDDEWRRRYRDRFFGKNEEIDKEFEGADGGKDDDSEPPADKITFNDILTEKGVE